MAEPSAADAVPHENSEQASTNEPSVIATRISLPEGFDVLLPGGILASDTVEYLRSALTEVKETCHLTAYSFECGGEVVNEFMELGAYLPEGADELQLVLKLDRYTSRKVRDHVKRTRDLLRFPSYLQTAKVDGNGSNEENEPKPETMTKTTEVAVTPGVAITAHDMLKPCTEGLSSYYDELLHRCGKADPVCMPSCTDGELQPNDLIKSISESGWNPVPAKRAMQGDLMYLEVVTANEGVLQITCTAEGFFVNRSSRNAYDGRPATNAAFHHELLFTLLAALPALKRSWCTQESRLIDAANAARQPEAEQQSKPLDVLVTLFSQGRTDDCLQNAQWIAPKASDEPKRVYDVARATNSANDRFGADLPGPPHDWNEDIQTARSVAEDEHSQRILKSKIIYKTTFDFRVAAEEGMKAIMDGHVTPFNPMDPVESQVYLYNGIFFSGAVDVQDTFKMAQGEVACRKYAGHDIKNQRFLQSLNISGLHTVLQSLMDFKGTRMVATTVIPGVLAASGGSSRLLAGCVEPGKRMCMKNEVWNTLADLGAKAHLAERTVPAIPLGGEEVADDKQRQQQQFGLGIDAGLDEPQSPIRVDNEDEKVAIDSATVPHIGPIEAKVIQGSDGRSYVLDLARLTPRDANYVSVENGGTGKIKSEDLSNAHEEAATAYVLRQELVAQFLKHKADKEQRDVYQNALEAEKVRREALNKALEEEKPPSAEDGKNADAEKDDKKNPLVLAFEAEQAAASTTLVEEVQKLKQAAKTRADSFRMNPNVFFPNLTAGTDAAILAQDEDLARDMATFLYDVVCPSVTRSIRTSESVPNDSAMAASMLQDAGINMRYLGYMAHLAEEEENKDLAVISEGKMNVQSMPAFWRDLLEVEMLARAVKIHLDNLMRTDTDVKGCPAPTIASVFSAILSKGNDVTTGDVTTATAVVDDDAPLSKNAKKNKKKKSKANTTTSDNSTSNSSSMPLTVNVAVDAEATCTAIDAILKSRFLYSLEDIRRVPVMESILKQENGVEVEQTKPALEKYAKDKSGASGAIGPRHSRIMVLRRICQQTGVRIIARDYKWSGEGSGVRADDIVELAVRTKECEPKEPSNDATEFLDDCRRQTNAGNLQEAYTAAQQCLAILTNVVGPVHDQVAAANDCIANILSAAHDLAPALVLLQKNLLTWVQLKGLDSAEVMSTHLRIASLHLALGSIGDALPHIYAARYNVELMGGNGHPLMIDILQKASEYVGHLPEADPQVMYDLLLDARNRCKSLVNKAYYTVMLANILRTHKHFELAISEMKNAHSSLQSVFGENDQRVLEVKDLVKETIREFTALKVNAARQAQAEASMPRLEKAKLDKEKELAILQAQRDAVKKQTEARKRLNAQKKNRRR